jgi:ATP-binding cassette subfamily B protein
MMLTISWKLTLVALLMIPVSMIAVILIVRKSQDILKVSKDFWT